jgi:hypothetical protein
MAPKWFPISTCGNVIFCLRHAGAITTIAFLSENWSKMRYADLKKYAYCSIAGEKKV